jgi:hypothetical protein
LIETKTTIATNLSKAAAAFLFVSLGAACSSSSSADSNDGGSSTDGESGGDAALDAGQGATGDGASSGDGSNAIGDAGSTDGKASSSPLAVNLATAGDYVILAQSGVSTVPTSAVTGDVGVSPAAASFITGFGLTADATNAFATSPQVTGHIYAADDAPPTPSKLTTAIGDMQLAFTDAAGRAPKATELGAGNIGGMTLTGGVYQWSSGLLIPTNVTLTGSATDVWIFQIAQNLTVSSATSVVLAGGALAKNVFWEVAGLTDLGTTSHVEGIILCKTSIALETGASINGRLLAQTAVSIDGSAVVAP